MEKLDRYPWAELYPLGPFHKAFWDPVWKEMMVRNSNGCNLHEWKECCGRPADDDDCWWQAEKG